MAQTKKMEQGGFLGRAHVGGAEEAEADLTERLREEGAPGHEPDENHSPEEDERECAVVDGIALADVAEEMFVDEIKPEETFGLAGGRIFDGREDVPGSGDDEHDDGARDEPHFQEMAEISDEQEKNENDGGGKNDADEAFGEDVEGDGDGESPTGEDGRIAGLPAVEEKVEAEADPETD